ncbi:hypothetical protein Dtox_3679 [Desulfofarcimen acetoxidans DSM 771]|uniref:Uncharacterized protein n=1 Tax=Desulfofarcimen acetoxidans (strain ATCC 49208 / DSM 771 / KCTC 5769 / VKM B-1644 / 5575) TaxID=485916 RepID=C8VWM4_DESAS|nr:hypothetical protein [Desulfofarcimen acetoxidans]ACV64388.1 hypothetical protein Dtox_3679 [Desulfofarcimen acetoxidans DSM 771]
MMHEEFCKLVSHVDTSVELPDLVTYSNTIEPVYLDYPTQGNLKKDFYVDMYINFGTRIFEDMLARARRVESLTSQIRSMQSELKSL